MTFEEWINKEYQDFGGPDKYFTILIKDGIIQGSEDITVYMKEAWDARYETLTYNDI